MATALQLMNEAKFIRGFEQTRTECSMNSKSRINDAPSDLLYRFR